jgi:hypothetical protein
MRSQRSGVTLVETLIYIVILVLITTMVVGILIAMTKSFLHFRTSRALSQAASVSMERMMYEIKQAENFGVGSIFDTNPGRLVLATTDAAGAPLTVEFSASSTQLLISEGGTVAELLPTNINLESLIFRQIITTNSKAVKVEMVLRDDRSLRDPLTLSATAVMRDSY